jgi:PIN like domain
LTLILEGRVAARPSDSQIAADRLEGERRVIERVPPGFRDRKKGKGADGDYLWWVEVLRYAASTLPPSIVIVSNDSKDDWVLEYEGVKIGPLPELVSEVKETCGATLLLMSVSEFLEEAGQASVSPVSPDTVQEVSLDEELKGRQRVSTERAALEEAMRELRGLGSAVLGRRERALLEEAMRELRGLGSADLGRRERALLEETMKALRGLGSADLARRERALLEETFKEARGRPTPGVFSGEPIARRADELLEGFGER